MPMDYQISYFGTKYFELYSIQTSSEKEIGDEIVERIKNCMEYTGDKTNAPETDAISRYYYSDTKIPVRTNVTVDLKKAVLHGDKGSVWICYTQEYYDENDECIYGSRDILARCVIEKSDAGEWIVTSVGEPP